MGEPGGTQANRGNPNSKPKKQIKANLKEKQQATIDYRIGGKLEKQTSTASLGELRKPNQNNKLNQS